MTYAIPIQNLYYLYAYAWDQFHFVHRIKTGEEQGPDADGFFGRILVQACRQIFRRGVGREYESREEELSQLRGRINVVRTIRHRALERGRVWCRFDELTADVLANQLIKATLVRLGDGQVPRHLVADIRKCVRTFDSLGVRTAELSREGFRLAGRARQSPFYAFLLHICELLYESLFPKHEGGAGQFASLLDDETKMSRIFERFVRNFFRHEQADFKVTSERIAWDIGELTKQVELLPNMHTDASLRSPERTVIIETKYYSETLHTHYDRKVLRSGHLYQLFAYLKNLEKRAGPDRRAEGLLLYPAVVDHVEFETTIQGHRMRACTIDLNQRWDKIQTELLSTIAPAGQTDGGDQAGK